MSTKRDNFQLSDKKLMQLAISLAENQKYFTGTNRSVGCVITRKNKHLQFKLKIVITCCGPFSKSNILL